MKKIGKIMLISIGLLTLASCGNSTPAISSTTSQNTPSTTTPTSTPTTTSEASSQSTSTTTITPEDITIEIPTVYTIDSQDNKSIPVIEYTGAPINIPFTAPEGCTSTIQYKLKGAQDSEYTTTAPKDLGEYEIMVTVTPPNSTTPIVVKKDIKIGIDFLGDYKQYENTEAYRKVSNVEEFLDALYDARNEYTSTITEIKEHDYIVRNNVRASSTNWQRAITKGLYLKNPDDTYTKIPEDTPFEDTSYTADMTYYEDSNYSKVSYTQDATKLGTVRVIELTKDLDLGYNLIKDLDVNSSVFENFDFKSKALEDSTKFYKDPDIKAAGISQIKVSKTTDLLIYSKNGVKLKHCGFSVASCKDVSFRNLEMDELWMWEDSTTTDLTKIGDYDATGWTYFKVDWSENTWIDHCTFGKSFDGQIDFANVVYDSVGTVSSDPRYDRAPYGGTGANGLKVTYCDFKAGSDDPDGYIYKMMERIEQEYQVYSADKTNYVASEKTCRYYFNLRDSGKSFTTILNAYAIPQKKGFLWGDSGEPYAYNKYLVATLANCTIKNIETRLPKVRGGMVYVYNVLVDNTEYFKANKYGNVSEGILSGLDASIYLESVEYKGIKNYLKNNDSSNDKYPTVNGGYMIKNSVLGTIVGSTDKENNTDPFLSVNSTTSKLSIGNFAFKVNGEKTDLTEPPFEIDAYKLVEDGEQVGSLEDYFIEHPTGVLR